jgi:protein required for attachment to host cells
MNGIATNQATEIPTLLDALSNGAIAGTGVLTAVLDTSPQRVPEKEYLIGLRDAIRRLRAEIPSDQAAAFDRAAEKAERLATAATPGRQGIVVYASDGPDPGVSVQVPVSVYDTARWGPAPDLQPLREASDERQRIAVLLFDSKQTRLFTIHLGAIEEHREADGDVPPRHAGGGWFALSQKRWDRHREQELQRHARSAVAMLERALRRHPFERLFIGGPPDAVSALRHQLPNALERRVVGTLSLEMLATPAQVLEAALEAAETAERAQEVALVQRLLDQRTATNVVIGLDSMLQALNDGRVNRLLVTDFRGVAGCECPACGRLTAGGSICPQCGAELTPVPDLRSAAVEAAIAQGARVDFLHGDAAVMLNEHGVAGAWMWY